MEVAILQLSDIHLRSARDSVLERAPKICGALHSAVPFATACVVLLSGDVAYSGKQAEYEIATSFFEQLRAELTALPMLQSVHFVSVPGNHDCDFEDESDLREFLLQDVQALYASGIKADSDKARILLGVQNNFFQLEAKLGGYKELAPESRIAWGRLLSFGNFQLKFQCFNTAWLSRVHEQQSKLFMPPSALEPYPGEASVSISVFHHPYNWLDANNYRQLKALVEKTSDFVCSPVTNMRRRRVQSTDSQASICITSRVPLYKARAASSIALSMWSHLTSVAASSAWRCFSGTENFTCLGIATAGRP